MQHSDEKKEKLNRLERKLYSKSAPNIIDTGRSDFTRPDDESEEDAKNVNENWQDIKTSDFDQLAAKVSQMSQKKYSFIKKIFILSLLFFIVASVATFFVFWGGVNQISSKNVDIKVVGPISVSSGQEASFDLNIINNNNTNLQAASILIKYPEGTRSSVDLSKKIDQDRFALNTIKPGESYSQNIKVVFFGEKDTLKQLKISLEYRIENSSALFYKEKIHEISISSVPIVVTSTYPKEVNSNQNISFSVEIVSNSKNETSNFLVNIEYPSGFVFKEALPSASYGDSTWSFPSLKSGEKKTILIKGNIIGQDNEEKIFKINIGIASQEDERIIAIPFSQISESILLKKPFIGLDILINGKEGNFFGQGGNPVSAILAVRNNLPTKLFNTSVEAAFKGGAFDASSVQVNNSGFFQSFNNTVLWDKRSVPEFSDMEPGLEKELSITLTPSTYAKIVAGAKPEIEMIITAKGERVLESGSIEAVSSTKTRKITLATDLSLSSKIARSLGNLENYGPVPPKVNIPTTYTIIWSVKNSFNQVSNVEVKATLPPYVKWTNLKSPQDEVFSFNQITNEVVWNVGSVLPDTGFNSSKKEIYFQLEFLPSLSQVGQTPVILGETSFSGIDKITNLKIESKMSALTTSLYEDPSFKIGDDRVKK